MLTEIPFEDRPVFLVEDPDAISTQTVNALAALFATERPQVIVEAGTYKGSFAMTAAVLLPTATILTADPIAHNWSGALEKNTLTHPERLIRHQGDFAELAHAYPDIVGKVDFAFIDSGWPMLNYEAGMRVRHFRLAQQWVRPDGLVVIDDLHGDWDGRDEIARTCCLVLNTDRGLGIWRNHERT